MSEESGVLAVNPALDDTFEDKDLPPLFHDADRSAVRAQKFFFAWLRWELLLLGLGVLVGAFNGVVDHIGPVSLLFPPFTLLGLRITTLSAFEVAEASLLALALVMRLARAISRPEQLWYEARAVAESVKSIAWRYAVGGEPFQQAMAPTQLDAIVTERLGDIRTDLSHYKASDQALQQHQVTLTMRTVRALPLATRQRIYRVNRVENQQSWYKSKARFNRRRAFQSHATLIAVEILAIFAALLPLALAAAHLFPLNLQSLAANIAGGGAAWMQAKRYEDLSASYKVTARELTKVAADIDKHQDEASWARFVENVEGSMSREHQLWRATRIE